MYYLKTILERPLVKKLILFSLMLTSLTHLHAMDYENKNGPLTPTLKEKELERLAAQVCTMALVPQNNKPVSRKKSGHHHPKHETVSLSQKQLRVQRLIAKRARQAVRFRDDTETIPEKTNIEIEKC